MNSPAWSTMTGVKNETSDKPAVAPRPFSLSTELCGRAALLTATVNAPRCARQKRRGSSDDLLRNRARWRSRAPPGDPRTVVKPESEHLKKMEIREKPSFYNGFHFYVDLVSSDKKSRKITVSLQTSVVLEGPDQVQTVEPQHCGTFAANCRQCFLETVLDLRTFTVFWTLNPQHLSRAVPGEPHPSFEVRA